MKNKYVVLAILISVLFGCSTNKKTKDFPPFTLQNVSEDSSIVTITYNEFIKNYQDKVRYQEILQKKKLSQKQKDKIYSDTYREIENNKKLKHETDYLGIQITPNEEKDYIYGNHINENIKSMPLFRDPKNQKFDKSLIKPFIERLSMDKNSEPYFIWNQHIETIKKDILRKKYEALLHASYLNTKTLNSWQNKLSVGESTIKIFSVPYNRYYDSIDPTDEDFMALLQKKSYDYQVSDKRYIRVATVPSEIHKHFHEKEYNAFKRYLETVNGFEEIAKQNDFIKTFSSFYTENTLPKKLKNFFESGKAGDTFGPYFENNSFRALKINKIMDLPTEAKAQHLVINHISKETILSIKKEIVEKVKKGASFLDLAKEFAEKYGIDGKWGDLDWFTYGEMVDDFSDSVFMNQPGKIVLAKSRYGWHIINILDHKNISKKYSFSALYWPLQPAQEDYEATITKANEFISSLDDHTQFESKASENGYPLKDYEASAIGRQFLEFEDSYEVFNWAYNAFENDMKTFRLNDKIYVVKLYKIAPPGLMPVFDARAYLRNGVFNEDVKAYLKKHIDEEKIDNMSIEQAAKYFNSPVYTIKKIIFTNNSAPKVGTDPYIVGLMTAIKKGERTKIIYGNQRFMVFEKLDENNKQVTTIVGQNKDKEWHTNMNNGRYKYAFKRNDRQATNIARKQDSYFLVPNYKNNLINNPKIAKEMYLAEIAFRNNEYNNALHGTKQYKGFESLIDKAPDSKQQRLLLLYAGLSALQIGEYQKVIDYLDVLNTEDRFFSIIKYGAQGDAYSQMGNDKKALEMYLKANDVNNNFVISTEYVIRAVAIYDKMGEYKKAYEHYKLLRTKYAPTRHNYETDKYIGHYEYLSDKSKIVVN